MTDVPLAKTQTRIEPPPYPTLVEATRVWARVALLSFGGPAGQIAIMQIECVDKRRWIDQGAFLRGLNYCMLLPGPEAQQLATWVGWRLQGWRGGLAAQGRGVRIRLHRCGGGVVGHVVGMVLIPCIAAVRTLDVTPGGRDHLVRHFVFGATVWTGQSHSSSACVGMRRSARYGLSCIRFVKKRNLRSPLPGTDRGRSLSAD